MAHFRLRGFDCTVSCFFSLVYLFYFNRIFIWLCIFPAINVKKCTFPSQAASGRWQVRGILVYRLCGACGASIH
jgi:hypothetical protein